MRIFSDEQRARIDYLSWAARHCIGSDKGCPGCGSASAELIRHKYLVTSLWECPTCHLRFRVPKETPQRAEELYREERYRQGFTTTLPSREELSRLLEIRFAGTEKDYLRYITVLQSVLPGGARILDFGSSWGYGSWQMSQAGFEVLSFEVGRQRSHYAQEFLGCQMIEDLRAVEGKMDCFFSAHVIEHLPDPNIVFREAAKVLVPGGYFVCFCPNGSPNREKMDPNYHKLWGKVHPLHITAEFMLWACERYGFALYEGSGGNATAEELLIVARNTV
jgi:2-polyprenyl-3-methyl-5-hydroxy-6-metoxy-1,4-benzoquinol methylase